MKIHKKDRLLSLSSGWDGIMVHMRTPGGDTAVVLSDDEAYVLHRWLRATLDERAQGVTRP